MKLILVVPAYNEEKVLENSITRLYKYMRDNIKYSWDIIIANNASTDNTKHIANKLANKLLHVKAIHLKFKGRGNALKYVWSNYDSDVYAYCDVDLATDIIHLNELCDYIISGKNIVIGSRYLKYSNAKRTIRRFILSKAYNYLIKLLFRTKIKDLQCGFKAIDKEIVKDLLPKIKNKKWFFDSELIIRAERLKKYEIKEIPVKWSENKNSKVKIFETVYKYITDSVKLRKELN